MIEDYIARSGLGIGGTFATIELANINTIVSIFVGLATLTFMVLSIIKIIRDLKK
jgi:hypothetical protein